MLLTIAIPTYNRSLKLELQLKSLLDQLLALKSKDVCILVQDNCSTDGTQEVCRSVISGYPHFDISYNRNTSNLGFDKNVDLCMENSTSKFTWILSDDDDLREDAVYTVLAALTKEESHVDFAFINYFVKSSQGSAAIKCEGITSKTVSGEELFYSIELSHSFISSCVFNVESWKSIDTSNYIGSLWIHLLTAREILVNGNALIISEPVITMNMPSVTESRSSKIDKSKMEFYTWAHIRISKFCKELESYGFSSSLAHYLSNKCRKYDIYQITNYKLSVGENSFFDMKRIAKAYKEVNNNRLIFWLLIFPMIFAPRELYKMAYWIKNGFK